MTTSSDDPVIAAKRVGQLGGYLRDQLSILVGQRLTHIGRTLNIIELGFGNPVRVPIAQDPERWLPSHIFHCQSAVEIDGRLAAANDIEQHVQWLNAFETPPACEEIDIDTSGTIQLTLSGGHLITIHAEDHEQTEHWRYFRPNDIQIHLVVFEA